MVSSFINITYRMVYIYVYFLSIDESTLTHNPPKSIIYLRVHSWWCTFHGFRQIYSAILIGVLDFISDCKLLLLYWLDDWFLAFYIHVNTYLYDILLWAVPKIIHHSHWTSGSFAAYSPVQKHVDRKVIIIRKNVI